MSYPLHLPAPARLARFKRDAASGEWARPMTWRDVRFSRLDSRTSNGPGFDGKTPVWCEYGESPLPRVKWAHDVEGAHVKHTGWFTNPEGETFRDGSGLARGVVCALPRGRFLAGYWNGDGGSYVWRLETLADETEAARVADRLAENMAESEREWRERDNEARELQDKTETMLQRLRECLALRHRQCMAYARGEARELVEAIREARARLDANYADFI